ncbi:MAG: DUF6807 family protein [Puia sp.]
MGILRYHARWVNQQNEALIEENTRYEFSGTDNQERIIDRITELTADTDILFADAKDGMLGLRLTRELQIPSEQEQVFTDNKGNKKHSKNSQFCQWRLSDQRRKTGRFCLEYKGPVVQSIW